MTILISFVISYNDYMLNHFNLQYIYPTFYKIAKRQTPEKGFAPIEK